MCSASGLSASMRIVSANIAFLTGHDGNFDEDNGPLLKFLKAREGLDEIVLQF